MKLLFSNPAGFWALLAVPAILLIHMLQERSRRVRVSTLFLLERIKPESVGGRRVEKLRNSVPLWLQLLAALVLTWLLCEPRWMREDVRRTVVVVLDSSASMSAFKEETHRLLQERLQPWTHGPGHTEWRLLESAPRKPTLYAGSDLQALLQALDKWEPLSGAHPLDDIFLTARSMVRQSAGAVVFVTDRKTPVPEGVALLSAGEPVENVGFSGAEIKITEGRILWSALVKNYGKEPAMREWWMESANGPPAKVPGLSGKLMIEPGRTTVLEGGFPEGSERVLLVLGGDRFTLDDRLPLQRPAPRVVGVTVRLKGAAAEIMKKMLGALDGVDLAATTPDLVVDELGTAVETHAVQVAVGAEDVETALDPGWVAAESNRLTRDLAWSSLLSAKPEELALEADDEPLLWKDGRVLALVRPGKKADGEMMLRLILNWDLTRSNAARLPAMLVMLQRFVDRVRDASSKPWAGNFELGENLPVSNSVSGIGQTWGKDPLETPFAGRAPERPGFFEVVQKGKELLRGAAHFADVREADFRNAEPLDTTGTLRREEALQQTEADPFTPLWILVVFGCLLGSWAWKNTMVKTEGAAAENLAGVGRPQI